ncbi:hypothetical protein GCM10023194_15420 [Planotetraspora phitsanulokensis]|uniref:Uncharacterized protein n=1 Tax=Planotetraspora phitsanulokensis TaxID=575192 RepID=A0A8J3U644_9ACTN|nr:hypothetical protein [Planotetraspora phitsanulokensis]GII38846.1 hypothetical protein Pph01_38490 [Planotetraspora phitsanulokensis]
MSNFSPPPRPGPPQRARTALALAGVTTIIGLAGLGIVLALSSSAGVVRGQTTPAAAPASFVVPGPATPPETPEAPDVPEATWAPGVIAGEAPGAQDAAELPPGAVNLAPDDPARQQGDPAKRRRGSGHPGHGEFTPSRTPVPVVPPRMPGKKPARPTPAAPAAPGAGAPPGASRGVAQGVTQAPPGAARSSAPRPVPGEPGPQPGAPQLRPSSTASGPATAARQPEAPQPGPSRLPDPCATYHDARRDYCYRVVAQLTTGG